MAIQEISIVPRYLERSIEPSIMAPEMMRVAENVDPTFLDGRLCRGAGFVRTKILPKSSTIVNIDVIERYDGNRMVVDCDAQGVVRLTCPEGTEGCGRTLAEWADADDFGGYASTIYNENFDEENSSTPDPQVGGY